MNLGLTPGTFVSRRISGQDSACWAITRSTAAISESRNSVCRRPASTDSRSSNGCSTPASQTRRTIDASGPEALCA
jgi:hypothetical protein